MNLGIMVIANNVGKGKCIGRTRRVFFHNTKLGFAGDTVPANLAQVVSDIILVMVDSNVLKIKNKCS